MWCQDSNPGHCHRLLKHLNLLQTPNHCSVFSLSVSLNITVSFLKHFSQFVSNKPEVRQCFIAKVASFYYYLAPNFHWGWWERKNSPHIARQTAFLLWSSTKCTFCLWSEFLPQIESVPLSASFASHKKKMANYFQPSISWPLRLINYTPNNRLSQSSKK